MEVDNRMSMRDICLLAGISHQSIRMYEKNGALPKQVNEENKYRYYHFPDMQRVIFLRSYIKAGIPIKKAAQLINDVPLAKLESTLQHQRRALQAQIEHSRRVLSSLERREQLVGQIQTLYNRYVFETRPEMYRLNCTVNGHVIKNRLLHGLMKEWADLMPITLLSGRASAQDMRPDQIVEAGYIIMANDAHLLSTLHSPYITHYPPCRCMSTVLRISSQARDFYSMGNEMNDYIRDRHLRITGDILSVSIANKVLTPEHPNDPSDYIRVWLMLED